MAAALKCGHAVLTALSITQLRVKDSVSSSSFYLKNDIRENVKLCSNFKAATATDGNV